jgi:uncharacterized coiled-coil protein SlyX
MDPDFLEFWGNLFINAAKGQRNMAEVHQWISQGLKGFDDLSKMVLAFYGFGGKTADSHSSGDAWVKVSKAFLDSYYEYIKLMGMVPETEYKELARKYEELEKKSAAQKETIEYLKGVLSKRLIDPSNTVESFRELMDKQSDELQRLMQGLNKAMGTVRDARRK